MEEVFHKICNSQFQKKKKKKKGVNKQLPVEVSISIVRMNSHFKTLTLHHSINIEYFLPIF